MLAMLLPWWLWFILAAILAVAELHFPGSYLIWLALGTAITSAAKGLYPSLSPEWQVSILIMASMMSCVAGYFVYRTMDIRLSNPAASLNRADLAMVGRRGMVSVRFIGGHGKVRIGDTVWPAMQRDSGADLQEGMMVIVVAMNGTRLVVSRDQREKRGQGLNR